MVSEEAEVNSLKFSLTLEAKFDNDPLSTTTLNP